MKHISLNFMDAYQMTCNSNKKWHTLHPDMSLYHVSILPLCFTLFPLSALPFSLGHTLYGSDRSILTSKDAVLCFFFYVYVFDGGDWCTIQTNAASVWEEWKDFPLQDVWALPDSEKLVGYPRGAQSRATAPSHGDEPDEMARAPGYHVSLFRDFSHGALGKPQGKWGNLGPIPPSWPGSV